MAARTNKYTISKSTGLTATQEQACALLASGGSIASVAEQVGVSRAALYLWQKQTTFVCYFNKLRQDTQSELTQGLFSLATEAINTIRESLHSDNEQIRLKAAMWITDKLQSVQITQTDALAVARKEATHAEEWEAAMALGQTFHESEYKERLKEWGIEEPNYSETLK